MEEVATPAHSAAKLAQVLFAALVTMDTILTMDNVSLVLQDALLVIPNIAQVAFKLGS